MMKHCLACHLMCYNKKRPKCAVLNWLTSMVMIGVTASLSFNGKVNEDLGIACFFACMFAFCVCMFARM